MKQTDELHMFDPQELDALDEELEQLGQRALEQIEEPPLILTDFDDDLEMDEDEPPLLAEADGAPGFEEEPPEPDERELDEEEARRRAKAQELAELIRKHQFNQGKPLPVDAAEDEGDDPVDLDDTLVHMAPVGRAPELESEPESAPEETSHAPEDSARPAPPQDLGPDIVLNKLPQRKAEAFPDVEEAMEEGVITQLPDEMNQVGKHFPKQPMDPQSEEEPTLVRKGKKKSRRKGSNPITAIQEKSTAYADKLFTGDEALQGVDLTEEERRQAQEEDERRQKLTRPVALDALNEQYTEYDDPEYLDEWEMPQQEEEEHGLLYRLRHREPEDRPPKVPKADIHPRKLAIIYDQGLKRERSRLKWALLLCLPLLYLNLSSEMDLPVFGFLWEPMLTAGFLLELLGVIVLLEREAFLGGLYDLFSGKLGLHVLTSLSVIFTAADCLYCTLVGRDGPLPCAAAAAFALCCVSWGRLDKRQAMRQSCRIAAVTQEPFRLERQSGPTAADAILLHRRGTMDGFGSRIQEEDGVERMTKPFCILVLVGAGVFTLVSSIGRGEPESLLWCASVIFTVAAPLSSTLAYGRPFGKIAARLSKANAALAGWDGICAIRGCTNVMVGDSDLFPTGMAKLNGLKLYDDVAVDIAVGYTASLIRQGGSGLDKAFYDLVHAQNAQYWQVEEFQLCEGGGFAGVIRDHEVLVGSASFMTAMEIPLDPGINVKDAVFCAMDGELTALFAMTYFMPAYVAPSLNTLLQNKLHPVLATRDFNITPELLRQKFNLPVGKLEYPPAEERARLSDPWQEEDMPLAALVSKEGLSGHAEAVVGGRQLYRTARRNAKVTIAAAVIGVLLGFYLTFVKAYGSLTPGNILLFLVIWLIPTLVMSASVDRY